MTDIKKHLLLLFDRPYEPIFTSRGDNVTIELPATFYTTRYRPMATQIMTRARGRGSKMISVKDITTPEIEDVMELQRNDHFSLFVTKHQKLAGKLIDVFMKMTDPEDFFAAACYAHDRVNPYLFQYAFAVALLHRDDTRDVQIPSLMETFPGKFVDSNVLGQLREEVFIVDTASREAVRIPRDYTASDIDPEHRLWYFREDPGLNLHHWHWHLVYPADSNTPKMVEKDRRGELFYYMHQQIIARYNIERIANTLTRVKSFNDFRKPISEGYFPKMDSSVASRAWPGRADNISLSDINRETDQIQLQIADLELWRDRILQAIDQMAVTTPNGDVIPLNFDENTDFGIDILGNLIESSSLSANRQMYGQLHNFGHVIISYVNDPINKHLESGGVMNDTATAMRDPIFYRWHSFINDLFEVYKKNLTPYTEEQLTWRGVEVTSIDVLGKKGAKNQFETFWNTSKVDFARGLDFQPQGSVFVEFDHLNHEAFSYKIQVENRSGKPQMGIFRVFMAPKKDECLKDLKFSEQRLMMIEMDKFIVQLNPGMNIVQHASTASSVTIPFEQTFRNLDQNRPEAGTVDAAEFNICGCGWPQHLLVPRGKSGSGQQFQLFVMVSDYENDKIDQKLVGSCTLAATFCGIRDAKYPDKRPMGYPFDREAREGVENLENFLTPNMGMQEVTVVFHDETRKRPSKS
ncbi:phenoloxidase 2-like [Culicoides brevitarsis]|uniref:phenoloxidase 2-like n=1 Tax=Culicoides brevitarsis TaxID=469753 RepID=UPI00307C0238